MLIRCRILCLFLTLLISGCFPWLHRIEVQQGNVLEQQQLDQLEAGMNKEQVRFLLGNPVLNDTLNAQRWDYYFSLKDDKGKSKSYWLMVMFQEGLYQKYVVGQRIFDLAEENP